MNTFLTVLLVVVQFDSGVSTAPAPREVGQTELYFPTAVGAKWVYRSYDHIGGHQDVTEWVTDVSKADGGKLVTVASRFPGIEIKVNGRRITDEFVEGPTGKFLVSKTRLVLVAWHGAHEWIVLDPPRCQFQVPTHLNEAWTWDGKQEGFPKIAMTTGKPERVTVRAGTFEAVPVYCRAAEPVPAGGASVVTTWYAPGIGEVKMMADKKLVRELISFTPGK